MSSIIYFQKFVSWETLSSDVGCAADSSDTSFLLVTVFPGSSLHPFALLYKHRANKMHMNCAICHLIC